MNNNDNSLRKRDNDGLSWYDPGEFTEKEEYYFSLIENSIRVQHADGKWRFIKLQPHQKEFHSKDIALLRGNAKHTIMVKSRNTSFTIDSCIRLLTGNYYYHDEIVPIVRMNETKVKELIEQIKFIIKHMRPIKMKDGSLFPFNPDKVVYSTLKIEFTDIGVTFQGYTSASPDSSENIRGVRTTRGLFDETNSFAYWKNILGAMMGANRGVDKDGNSHFQVTMGTTLKGMTDFYEWYQDVESKPELQTKYDILKFPVFDPDIFNPEIPPNEQPDLIPIVFWHSIEKLTEEWYEDLNKFMEEYMAVVAPPEGAYFDMKEVIASSTEENTIACNANEKLKTLSTDSYNTMGVDPAGDGVDYFSISIFNYDYNTKERKELYHYNVQKVSDPMVMVDLILDLYKIFNCIKIRIDGNDLGYFIATSLRNELGSGVVEIMRGNTRVKNNETTMPLKEFMFANMVKGFRTSKLKIVSDELIQTHFSMWKNDYSCDRNKKYGHGDSVISIGLAALPLNWRIGVSETPNYDLLAQINGDTNETKEKQDYSKMAFEDKISFYKKNRNSNNSILKRYGF